MGKEIGRYDTSLHMFVEPVKELDHNKLEFHKFLADEGMHADDMYADVIKLDEVRKELAEMGQH